MSRRQTTSRVKYGGARVAKVDFRGRIATPEFGAPAPAGKFKVLIHWRTKC